MLESVEIETTHFSPIFYFNTPENDRKAKVFKGDLKQTFLIPQYFIIIIFFSCRCTSNFCWCFYEASFE